MSKFKFSPVKPAVSSHVKSHFKSFLCNNCSTTKSIHCKHKPTEISLWHKRLGHPCPSVLSHVIPFSVHEIKQSSLCAPCILGKMPQKPFPTSLSKSKSVFELVYSDLWGPAPATSCDGYKYYVLFVDYYSRFTWIFPLKLKSDTLSVFLKFNAFIDSLIFFFSVWFLVEFMLNCQ